MKNLPDPNCEWCGGSGEMITPSYQQAGIIIDEQSRPCSCVKNSKNHEDIEDDDSGEESDNESDDDGGF